ncbi:YlxR family protein [Knoellia koreensis]|uniref:YlxR family protein n=1 Tax=Knoellia koreensis TaxID=2730921 RepID=UPI003D2A3601
MGTDRTGLRPSAVSTTPRTTHGSPTRTCVGCRRTDSWSALLRVVAETDDTGAIRLTPDPRHRLPGRGAWLHPTGDCLDQALRRRAFGRALRTSTAPDPAAVTAYVEELATRPLAAPPEK